MTDSIRLPAIHDSVRMSDAEMPNRVRRDRSAESAGPATTGWD